MDAEKKESLIMKKIINNKIYDTGKAQKCGEYESTPYRNDFHYFCETLYRKKTGEFFLHGEGNAASKYARSCGQNERCRGEKIVPLTYEAAQQWAEEHLDGDSYIEIFGEPEEDDSVEALNIRISSAKMKKLRQAAGRDELTLVALVEKLIDNL